MFGDGPASATLAIVHALNRRGATATFLLNDAAVGHHPDVARSLVAGEAVGISEPPHDATAPMGEDALLRTADRTRDDLAAATGHTPACFLVPYGATDATRTDVTAHGLKPVVWDVDPEDWRRPTADAIAADVVDNVHDGAVVLLHDGGGDRSATVAALPAILDTLQGRGYAFAALPGC